MTRRTRNTMPPALALLNVLSILGNLFTPQADVDYRLKSKRLEKLDHDIQGVDARAKVSNNNNVVVMLRAEKLEKDIALRELDIQKRTLECEALRQQLGIIRPDQQFQAATYDAQRFDADARKLAGNC